MNASSARLEDRPMPSRVELVVRSALFWVVFMTTLLIFAPLTLLVWPLPFRLRYRVATQWGRLSLAWLSLTCRLTYQVTGAENIPDETGIVLCKHQSTWETLAMQTIFPPQVWVLKRELLWLPFFGWALAALKPIAINRKAGRKAVEQLVQQGTERLAQNLWVIVFPEGTRIAPGQRGRYRIGGAVLAERSGFPVVPVAHNAGEFWPRHGFVKRPGIIQVVIGPTIMVGGKQAAEILREAEDWIEGTMQKISAKTG